MRIEIVHELRMPAETDRQIRAVLVACFPKDAAIFAESRGWHGSQPVFSAVALHGERVIGHVGVVDRVVTMGGAKIRIFGVQNVAVLPDFRGKGYVDHMLAAVAGEAERQAFDMGLLFCGPLLEKVYRRCGWRTLSPRAVEIAWRSGQRDQLDPAILAMIYPLRMQEVANGPINLNGPDW